MSALMARIAKIDLDHVYWGLGDAVALDQVRAGDFVFGAPAIAAALPAGAVYVAEDCDLPGGRYRFVQAEIATVADARAALAQVNATAVDATPLPAALWRLDPLEGGAVKATPSVVTAERALYEQLKLAHQAAPAAVAPLAAAWAALYETSWDADNGQTLGYFRALKGS